MQGTTLHRSAVVVVLISLLRPSYGAGTNVTWSTDRKLFMRSLRCSKNADAIIDGSIYRDRAFPEAEAIRGQCRRSVEESYARRGILPGVGGLAKDDAATGAKSTLHVRVAIIHYSRAKCRRKMMEKALRQQGFPNATFIAFDFQDLPPSLVNDCSGKLIDCDPMPFISRDYMTTTSATINHMAAWSLAAQPSPPGEHHVTVVIEDDMAFPTNFRTKLMDHLRALEALPGGDLGGWDVLFFGCNHCASHGPWLNGRGWHGACFCGRGYAVSERGASRLWHHAPVVLGPTDKQMLHATDRPKEIRAFSYVANLRELTEVRGKRMARGTDLCDDKAPPSSSPPQLTLNVTSSAAPSAAKHVPPMTAAEDEPKARDAEIAKLIQQAENLLRGLQEYRNGAWRTRDSSRETQLSGSNQMAAHSFRHRRQKPSKIIRRTANGSFRLENLPGSA